MAPRQLHVSLLRTHELGGGDLHPVRLIHDGRIMLELLNGQPTLHIPEVTLEPDAHPAHGLLYFRDSGNGMQLCVKFPSGATQILATEPA